MRAIHFRDAAVGGGLILLALAVVIPTAMMPVGFSYDQVGPRAFPYVIAAALVVSGASVLLGAFASGRQAIQAEPTHWPAVAVISAALIFEALLIRQLGWIPVAALAFVAVAWAFGSRRLLVSLGFGLALAAATFLLFNYALGLRLPVGTVWMKLI